MSGLFDLSGKVAVITGSSRGIGRAIAERMAEAGARVTISSRKAEACDAVASAINERHGEERALAIPANISDRAGLQHLVTTVCERWGSIDTLVCNAATNLYYGPLGGISDDQFRKVLDNNIIANHWLISMVAPQMRERRSGAIIIVSSIGGITGSAVLGAYNISKAADMQMARNLAVEFGPDNVRVNCIAPGLIKTDFSKALWDNPATAEGYATRTPLRRMGEPDEVAGAALFLSSQAGAYVTGQTLIVDGGVTISGVSGG
ncbi:SDR family oxidoreductase [Mesorhizobium sp. CAU 1732]|uniref:SDR family NAD(P)-dependent oxidoreductase n=1 Tax=Mesorhizobium sp. CAU 1732 TaxID=3140358 RepID=UPI003260D773